MMKKIVSLLLAVVMTFSLVIPAFAITNVNHPDFNRDRLREVVVNQTTNLAGLIADALPEDTIKGIVKDTISGMLNFNDIGNYLTPVLGGLLEKTLSDSLGLTLPDSINIDNIINEVLSNEYVGSILTSEFVNKVIDRTIDNLIEALDISIVIDILAESVVDQLTDEIWNNGNPSSSSTTIPIIGTIQTGHWNTTGGWNSTNIFATIALKLGYSGSTGSIANYVDTSKIDFTKIFNVDTILNAFMDAVTETATEYYDIYKPVLEAKVQAKIEELKEKAKADLIEELNRILALRLSAKEDLEALEAKIIAYIGESKEYITANREKILEDVKALQTLVNKLDKYACLDLGKINCLLDKIIKCLEEEEEKPPVLVSIVPGAVVEKIPGNKNNLTITIMGTFSDGSTKMIAEKTFVIDNNAIGVYEVGGYKIYVDTKGNIQIRDIHVVA